MKRLMLQALEEMRHRGYALAVLIPATHTLFDVYRRLEFANAFDYAIEEIRADKSITFGASLQTCALPVDSHDQLSLDTLYDYYRIKQLERTSCILHSADQFDIICQDRILGGGEIWTAIADEQLVGLAFTDPVASDTLSVREIMYNDTETKNKLVQFILKHHQLNSAKLRVPPTPSVPIPYGMARIINKEQMIDLNDQSSKLSDFINSDIPSITQILLQYDQRQPYMNLMLD